MVILGYEKCAMELGSRIKNEISRAGYKQIVFADLIGIQPSRLSNYINGVRVPDIFTLKSIADQLGVSLDYLYSGKNESYSLSKKYMLTIFDKGNIRLECID